MARSKAYQMGIRGRAPKVSKHAGQWIKFTDRNGAIWTVNCDSTGYAYPSIDGSQVTSTAYGYAFSIEDALLKALAQLEVEKAPQWYLPADLRNP